MPACSLSRLKSMQVLLGQGETLLKTSKVCSRAGVCLSLRSTSGLALRSEQKRGISVVGVNQELSFGINSRHHLRLLSLRKSMSASGSKTVFGDVYIDDMISGYGSVSDFSKSTGVYFADRSLHSCKRASISLRCQNPTQNNVVCGHSMFDTLRRIPNSNPLVHPWLRSIHSMSALCYSSGASPDVTFEGSTQIQDGQVTASEASPHRSLKLLSGSCYLPHPEKEETGGEDAHFICADEQVIGVADGVGGWADVGVNAGLFAQELMLNSVAAIQEEPKGSIDPARVLEKAHSGTKAKGSSTACIIALSDQGIHAINLGDSGFIVVRDGCTIFESPVQQHGFNFTYQLECGNGGDLPRSGQVFTLPVVPGDVIVAGTDGLFDNLYKNEVTAVVVDAVRSGLEPQAAAQKITALARQRALEKNRQTPFSTAAQEAGYRYHGGKLDDITVVVSYITSLTSP